MTFFIQASNPVVTSQADASDDELRDVIEDVFASETEDAILNWNGVSVALSYKYDISVMIEDLMDAITAILSTDVGELVVTWPSNTFLATWVLAWGEQGLTCTATWDSISGGVEDLLTRTGGVRMSKGEFLAEWRAPVERVVSGLQRAGASPSVLMRLQSIEGSLGQLDLRGRLYR